MSRSKVGDTYEATDDGQPLTDFLKRWKDGSQKPGDEVLMKRLYDDVKRIARRRLRCEGQRPFDTTDLAHECFQRLIEQRSICYADRRHFFGIAGRLLRQVLVDEARWRAAGRRSAPTVVLNEALALPGETDPAGEHIRILDLNEALDRLGSKQSRQVTVVNLRFFGGMTIKEIAKELGLAQSTVKLDWQYAKARLQQYLSDT